MSSMPCHFLALTILFAVSLGVESARCGPAERLRDETVVTTSILSEEHESRPLALDEFAMADKLGDEHDSEMCTNGVRWRFAADALFWQRRQPGAAVLISNTADASQAIRAEELDYGFHTGPRLSVSYELDSGRTLEVSWLGIDSWHTGTTVATTSNALLRVNSAIPVFALAGDEIEATASSSLQNFEINLYRQPWASLRWLAGFRYLELDEQLAWQLHTPPIPFAYAVTTRNRMYGAQVGAEATLWNRGGPLSLGVLGKVGLYGNAVNHLSQYVTNVTALSAGDSMATLSLVSDIQLSLVYQVTDHWSMRAGYQLLWIEQAALAVDQVAVSDFVFDRGLDAKGDAFYHGAIIGLEYAR